MTTGLGVPSRPRKALWTRATVYRRGYRAGRRRCDWWRLCRNRWTTLKRDWWSIVRGGGLGLRFVIFQAVRWRWRFVAIFLRLHLFFPFLPCLLFLFFAVRSRPRAACHRMRRACLLFVARSRRPVILQFLRRKRAEDQTVSVEAFSSKPAYTHVPIRRQIKAILIQGHEAILVMDGHLSLVRDDRHEGRSFIISKWHGLECFVFSSTEQNLLVPHRTVDSPDVVAANIIQLTP